MIIEFTKKNNFYDKLINEIYDQKINKKICYNFIPIKICDEHYILTSSKNLEGYLIDYKDNISVNLYINNNTPSDINNNIDSDLDSDTDDNTNSNNIECIELTLNNVVTFGTKLINRTNCYIDTINNLLLIKFNSPKLNYILIDNNLDCQNDLRYDNEKINLKYVWTDENLNLRTLIKHSKIINTWNDKYINLPPIPYMIDDNKSDSNNSNFIPQLFPITGSAAYDSDNNFLGMVSYVNSQNIIITPLICIKKMYDYLLGEQILYLGIDTYPIKLDFKSGLNKIDYQNGLLITNNYYDNIIDNINKIKKKIKKINNRKNLEESNLEESNLEEINLNEINFEENGILDNSLKNTLNSSLENSFFESIEYDKNLKSGNIICSIDRYVVNSSGLMIIHTNCENKKQTLKTIPIKSYIWLFKNSHNDRLVLNNILPNNYYRGNLLKLRSKNNMIVINDSFIKKQINLNESNFILKSEYNIISTIGYNNLKYISHNNLNLIEINEKILEIMKEYITTNQTKYSHLIDKIFNNKYTYTYNKQLLLLVFEKKNLKIKMISNENQNFEDIINKYKTNKELKKFLLYQSRLK